MAVRCSDCCKVNCLYDTGDTGSVCPIGTAQRFTEQAHEHAVNVLAHEQARARKLQHDKFCAEEKRKETARTMANMSGSNDFKCPICQTICLGRQGLCGHMRTHYQPFTCNICSKSIPNFASATKHHKQIKCLAFNMLVADLHFKNQKELFENQIP